MANIANNTAVVTPTPIPGIGNQLGKRTLDNFLLEKRTKAEVLEMFHCPPATERPIKILVPVGTPVTNRDLTPERSARQSFAQLEKAKNIEFDNFKIKLKNEINNNFKAFLAKVNVNVSEDKKNSLIDTIADELILYYDNSLTSRALVETALKQEDVVTEIRDIFTSFNT
jgi:hypothetical protein